MASMTARITRKTTGEDGYLTVKSKSRTYKLIGRKKVSEREYLNLHEEPHGRVVQDSVSDVEYKCTVDGKGIVTIFQKQGKDFCRAMQSYGWTGRSLRVPTFEEEVVMRLDVHKGPLLTTEQLTDVERALSCLY